jgi:hypothetical protein
VDQTDEILAALRALMEKASIPVVRACLEEAHDDIAHLTEKDTAPAWPADQAGATWCPFTPRPR